MKQSEKDAGTIVALVMRLRSYRIPRARRMLAKVQDGKVLADQDIEFLDRVFRDARQLGPLVRRNPEYMSVVSRMIDLYQEITELALNNEQNRKDG